MNACASRRRIRFTREMRFSTSAERMPRRMPCRVSELAVSLLIRMQLRKIIGAAEPNLRDGDAEGGSGVVGVEECEPGTLGHRTHALDHFRVLCATQIQFNTEALDCTSSALRCHQHTRCDKNVSDPCCP